MLEGTTDTLEEAKKSKNEDRSGLSGLLGRDYPSPQLSQKMTVSL